MSMITIEEMKRVLGKDASADDRFTMIYVNYNVLLNQFEDVKRENSELKKELSELVASLEDVAIKASKEYDNAEHILEKYWKKQQHN